MSDFEDWIKNTKPVELSLKQWLVNGAGLLLFNRLNTNMYFSYLRRIHELDRLLVLADVAEKLLEVEVNSSEVNGWLLASPDSMRDPLNGRPAKWENGILRFEVDGKSNIKPRLNLQLSAGSK